MFPLRTDPRDFCKPFCCDSTHLPLGVGAGSGPPHGQAGPPPSQRDHAKAPALPRTRVLPGFVSRLGKLSCSSEVSGASTPRSEDKPQYFFCPIKGILIDLFTSRRKVRTHGPYTGIKRVLFTKRCAGVHHVSSGSPGTKQHLSCSCGTNP